MDDLIWNGFNIPREELIPDKCTRMQGILVLGPVRWGMVEEYRDALTTTWYERQLIDNALVWSRTGENIQFFAWLCSLSDDEVNDLFRIAERIEF